MFSAGSSKPSNDRTSTKPKLNKLSNKVKSQERTLNIIDSNITDYSIKSHQCSEKIKQLQNELNDCKKALKDAQNKRGMMKEKCANLEKKHEGIAQQKIQTNNEIATILKLVDPLKELAAVQKMSVDVQKEMVASTREMAKILESLKTAQLSYKQQLDGELLVH